MVITRRRAFRRNAVRALYRRSRIPRYTSRRGRSNRLFRRFANRRAIRPELKFITLNSAGNSPGSGTVTNWPISPEVIEQGTNWNQRIGNQCRFTKLHIKMYVYYSGSDDSTQATKMFRLIFWTPRVKYDNAAAYMLTQNMISHVDFSQVTVWKDMVRYLSLSYMAEATTNDIAGGNNNTRYIYNFSFKFPRKIEFSRNVAAGSINQLDPNKDIMFMTWINADLSNISFSIDTKLWYFDA